MLHESKQAISYVSDDEEMRDVVVGEKMGRLAATF